MKDILRQKKEVVQFIELFNKNGYSMVEQKFKAYLDQYSEKSDLIENKKKEVTQLIDQESGLSLDLLIRWAKSRTILNEEINEFNQELESIIQHIKN